MSEVFINKLGGRKFCLALLVYLITVFQLIIDKLTKDDYYTIVTLIITSYIIGSLSQKFLVNKTTDTNNEEITDIITNLGGRVFSLVIFIYIITSVLLTYSYISSNIFVNITQWVMSLYIAGNVTEKIINNGLSITINKK